MSATMTIYHRHRFDQITDYLHHRPPYLLVDRIDSIEDHAIKTSKTIAANDLILAGHFPGAPVFPGAMMQELVTQSAGILIAANYNPMAEYDTTDPMHNRYALGVLVRVERARYWQFARPGDTLDVTVELKGIAANLFAFKASIQVVDRRIMQIEFQLANIPAANLNAVGESNQHLLV